MLIWLDHWDTMIDKSKMSYECKYCGKAFSKESTLTSHACEKKRRFQQEFEIGVQWGLRAYLTFYETTQQSNKAKSYADFVASPYYTSFVKFGRYCHSIHCIQFDKYTRWLLKNNYKLDLWCQERYYADWLFDYLRRESVQDALERSIQCMIDFMHDRPEYRNGYRDYFRLVNENRICYHISTGRVSMWAVYNCRSGQEFLERLSQDQLTQIMTFIDPDFWQSRFRDCAEDAAFSKKVLKAAGL